MAEETITNGAPVDDGGTQPQLINGIAVDDNGQAIPVPEDTEPSTQAVEEVKDEPSEQTQEEATGATTALPEADDKLQKFASSHGLELDSPNAIKAAKIAMDNQADFHRERQSASELEKIAKITPDQVPEDFTPEQNSNVRIRNIELTNEAMRWKQDNPEKVQYEAAMADILVNDPGKRLMVQEGYLSLDDVYNIARGSSSSDVDLKAQGAKQALETLRDNQQAATPRGAAVSGMPNQSDKITPQNVDSLVGQHDLKWYEAHRDEINRAMAG